MVLRFFSTIAALSTLLFFTPAIAQAAQEPTDAPIIASRNYDVKATVEQILRDETVEGRRSVVFIAQGEDGQTYEVDSANSFGEGLHVPFRVGDRVILSVIDNGDGTSTPYLADIVRTSGVLIAFIVFALITLFVGGRRGALAILGLAVTIGILFLIVFPQILSGANPVLVVILAGLVILLVNILAAHGFSKNGLLAFGSITLGVLLAWLFGEWFVDLARLSGLATEESTFLYLQVANIHLPQGILLAGILLGTLGVLDDVAITQCETVAELKKADENFGARELFVRGMRVGRHHIASTVNTLVLAYAGASLPLFLLFLSDSGVSLSRFLNTEAIAEEIIRTLAGTTALVLTVPIATALAAWFFGRHRGTMRNV